MCHATVISYRTLSAVGDCELGFRCSARDTDLEEVHLAICARIYLLLRQNNSYITVNGVPPLV